MTHTKIVLIGNPNCGKTTLFNALTGDTQRVGNWPGVTVEKKTGVYTHDEQETQVTDLPGVYSLVSSLQGSSQDAQIAALAVANNDADILVNVVDACHLERHLYLTTQLLELGRPLILALNMTDIAALRGISIDTKALSRLLHCPVIVLEAHRHVGIMDLKQAILRSSVIVSQDATEATFELPLPSTVQHLLTQVKARLSAIDTPACLINYYASRVLEGDTMLVSDPSIAQLVTETDVDVLMADARYQAIHQVVILALQKRSDASEHLTAKIDRLVLHRFWALPIFFAMMYLMFLVAIDVGGAFQDFFDITTDAVFVQGSARLLQWLTMPDWLIAVCANGVGRGINTTLTFVPVMASMYFFLSLLEASGYMARAAFVVDKAMRILGLPGKAFVPMIVGFGCNVPAIMAARTLDSERDRLLTVLMSPFMSCSARLAIYAVFVAAFFPTGGQNIVFSLYLIGILMAVLTGFLLRNTLFRGQASPLILELPAYHRPSLRRILRETNLRLRYFITRAGKLIIPACVVLGGLNALAIDGGLSTGSPGHESILALIGQWLVPVFSPMGLHQDNWPAAVGLLTGTLAKEVVVGSLNSLYAQMANLTPIGVTTFDFLGSLQTALWSIPQNLKALAHVLIDPAVVSLPDNNLNKSVYGVMYHHFDGKVGAYAYLLFISLYIPCVSTMAAIRQEANRQLMWFSIVWSIIVAYTTATLFYQVATVTLHPEQTLAYFIGGLLFIVFFVVFIRRVVAKRPGGPHVAAIT